MPVSVFIKGISFDKGLEKFAFANNLKVQKTEDNIYVLERNENQDLPQIEQSRNRTVQRNKKPLENVDGLIIEVLGSDSAMITALNVPISDIVNELSGKLGKNYFLLSDISGKLTIKVNKASYDDLLTMILRGTNATYRLYNNTYLIGDKKTKTSVLLNISNCNTVL